MPQPLRPGLPLSEAGLGRLSQEQEPKSKPKKTRNRRILSCLPCRLHKLKCDRTIPCHTCRQYNRQDQCRLHPAPESVIKRGLAPSLPQMSGKKATSALITQSSITKVVLPASTLPSTPLSVAAITNTSEDDYGFTNSQPNVSSDQVRTAPTTLDSDLQSIIETRLRPMQYARGSPPSHQYSPNTAPPPVKEASLSVASLALQNPFSSKTPTLFDEPQLFWKRYLLSLLPAQTQADLLVTYFFENINWIYHAIHAPSFRAQYSMLWSKSVEDVDLIWLSLLFIMFSLSSLYIPAPMAEAAGFEVSDLAALSHRWYSASRQSLQSGGYESKPTLIQLQVFIVTQLYWYGTKDIEALNTHLAQAIRQGQALGLDRESPPSMSDCLERELRHRVWWDLAGADTFQSLCLGRPPLLQSHLSNVPFPSNCNDVDINSVCAQVKPLNEPTEMSMHHFRGRIFKVFNKLWLDNGANLGSHDFVSSIDAELTAITDQFPWYFKDPARSVESKAPALPPNFGFVLWGHHLLDSCIAVQRVRMYRPFLQLKAGEMFQRCVTAGSSTLTLYKALRSPDEARFRRSDKLRIQAYHVISAAIVLATFLLVEQPANAASIRHDIEMIASDLQPPAPGTTEDKRSIATIDDGLKVLHQILSISDDKAFNLSQDTAGPAALAPGISSVFGGEATARRYLERCAFKYLGCDDVIHNGQPMASATSASASSWEALMDPSSWGEWGDGFWAELDLAMGEGSGEM
ncbi:putative transcriptional regulatory protein [Colletotrichum fructicola Nara gc5]|nr:putative transcriptional regulatory protein [Colletotrichum fructicola Nara gc5]